MQTSAQLLDYRRVCKLALFHYGFDHYTIYIFRYFNFIYFLHFNDGFNNSCISPIYPITYIRNCFYYMEVLILVT